MTDGEGESTEAKPKYAPRLINCQQCMQPFFRTRAWQKWCSRKCANVVLSRRWRERHKPKGEAHEQQIV